MCGCNSNYSYGTDVCVCVVEPPLYVLKSCGRAPTCNRVRTPHFNLDSIFCIGPIKFYYKEHPTVSYKIAWCIWSSQRKHVLVVVQKIQPSCGFVLFLISVVINDQIISMRAVSCEEQALSSLPLVLKALCSICFSG